MNNFDTVIIGGGLAGLSAALLLQKQGQQVAVFEKSQHLGGRAHTRQKDGYYLNLGPHALYRGGAGMKVLNGLGIQPQGKTPGFGKSPTALTGSGLDHLPLTPGAFFRSKMLRGRRLGYLQGLLKMVRHEPSARLNQMTWRQWLDQNISDHRLRVLFETTSRLTTYANDPDRMSAGATLAQVKLALTSNVLYLDRGWGQLVSDLRQKAAAAGIPMMTQARATAIFKESTDGYKIEFAREKAVFARHVVLAIPPAAAVDLLPASESLAQVVDRLRPIQAACLTVGLRRLPNPDIQLGLGVGLSYYHVVHSKSARLAPAGHTLVHTAVYIAPDDHRSPEEHRAFMEQALDQLQPGWRQEAVLCDFLPRMTVTHALVEAARPRPSIVIEDSPNVYVIGDWVDAEGMLADTSLASARDVAMIISHHG
ncbi:MAG: FAD-dependent oxidoreductase [Ardenticatenaceae bacterium]|nr:FAD-dependent oxidoreductase [Ardenticatenaceae bacterium]